MNKIDLLERGTKLPSGPISVSLKEDIGIDSLLEALSQKIKENYVVSSSLIVAHQRQYDLLCKVLKALELFDQMDFIELKAEALRESLNHLGSILGKIDVEEILGKIFSSFCIGK